MAVTLSLFAGAGAQFFDNNGNLLSSGLLYTYAAGTTTPQATYTDVTGNTALANPIVLDSAGRVPTGEIWLTYGVAYKFVVKDSNNTLIGTYDNIPSATLPPLVNTASSISYDQGYTVTAGNFRIGETYLIKSIGSTNFQLIGASSNDVGVYFVATGVGTGTGTADFIRSVQTRLRDYVSVKDYGATGDGTTDDTVAIQAALTNSAGLEVVFPSGTYKVTSSVYISAGTTVTFEGQNSKLLHYGSSHCLVIKNSKNIILNRPFVDLTYAGPTATGIAIQGTWFTDMFQPRVLGGNVGQTGIWIETSGSGQVDYGAYCINIYNPDLENNNLSGTLGYGIQSKQTAGDAVQVTHLNIYAGWFAGNNYGIYLRSVDTFRIEGATLGTGIDLINLEYCYDGYLSPGEMDSCSGYWINFGVHCARISIIQPSLTGPSGTLGTFNYTNYRPNVYSAGTLGVVSVSPSYHAEFVSAANYSNSFNLNVTGGAATVPIISWGDVAGLKFDGGAGAVYLATNATSRLWLASAAGTFYWAPVTDTGANLGSAAYRWGTVYAATGTINTSDGSQKQQVNDLTLAELATAKTIKGLIKTFKFNDAVEAKNDKARIHVGVIAQDVEKAFTDNGLDASKYGIFCSDTWTDDAGVEHTRLGIRYDELIAFIIAAL